MDIQTVLSSKQFRLVSRVGRKLVLPSSFVLSSIGLLGVVWSVITLYKQTTQGARDNLIVLDNDTESRQYLFEKGCDAISTESGSRPAVEPQNSAGVTTPQVVVSISGAVEKPGVYELQLDSRIIDVVKKAGGISTEADVVWVGRNVNMASKLTPEQHIYVPYKAENLKPSNTNADDNEVSTKVSEGDSKGLEALNAATEQELQEIQGIGPAYSKRILDAQPFTTWDEVREKAKLSSTLVERIREKYLQE